MPGKDSEKLWPQIDGAPNARAVTGQSLRVEGVLGFGAIFSKGLVVER